MDKEKDVIYVKSDSRFVYRLLKRITDILISLFGILLLLIFTFIIFLFNILKKEDRGPIFFKQKRVGLNGNIFYIYKFRSMIVNADKKLIDNPTLYREYVNNNYKLEPQNDPRITKIGLFLRKTSIDELPQFINVLKGDMSLVGPRPVIKKELCEYEDKEKLLSIKPGIMGLWQSYGRSNIGYPERADIEMKYIEKASYMFDLKIMIMNIIIVFKKDGAY